MEPQDPKSTQQQTLSVQSVAQSLMKSMSSGIIATNSNIYKNTKDTKQYVASVDNSLRKAEKSISGLNKFLQTQLDQNKFTSLENELEKSRDMTGAAFDRLENSILKLLGLIGNMGKGGSGSGGVLIVPPPGTRPSEEVKEGKGPKENEKLKGSEEGRDAAREGKGVETKAPYDQAGRDAAREGKGTEVKSPRNMSGRDAAREGRGVELTPSNLFELSRTPASDFRGPPTTRPTLGGSLANAIERPGTAPGAEGWKEFLKDSAALADDLVGPKLGGMLAQATKFGVHYGLRYLGPLMETWSGFWEWREISAKLEANVITKEQYNKQLKRIVGSRATRSFFGQVFAEIAGAIGAIGGTLVFPGIGTLVGGIGGGIVGWIQGAQAGDVIYSLLSGERNLSYYLQRDVIRDPKEGFRSSGPRGIDPSGFTNVGEAWHYPGSQATEDFRKLEPPPPPGPMGPEGDSYSNPGVYPNTNASGVNGSPFLESYLTSDKRGTQHASGINPEFGQNLKKFLDDARAAGHDIEIYSGYRTPERQAQLWQQALAKYGSADAARRWVAPPGHSMHNKGLAADLRYGDSGAASWAHSNASKYGLRFRMGNENWHIEPSNGALGTQLAGDVGAAPGVGPQEENMSGLYGTTGTYGGNPMMLGGMGFGIPGLPMGIPMFPGFGMTGGMGKLGVGLGLFSALIGLASSFSSRNGLRTRLASTSVNNVPPESADTIIDDFRDHTRVASSNDTTTGVSDPITVNGKEKPTQADLSKFRIATFENDVLDHNNTISRAFKHLSSEHKFGVMV